MNRTPIDWVKNPDGTPGYTWNPITGCLNGCPYCYARKLANGRLRSRYLANENLAGGYRLARGVLREGAILPQKDPFYPHFWPDRMQELSERFEIVNDWGQKPKQRGIFVCDMSDLFGIGIPHEWTEEVIAGISALSPYDRFYLLTKQPQNLIKWSPFPDNCWVGVSTTNERAFQDAWKYLPYISAKVKYLSIEPMQSRILTTPHQLERFGLDLVIIGSQTKPYKPPKIEWVKEIVEACDKAGVAVFLKDNLKLALPFAQAEWAWARDAYATAHSSNIVYTGYLRQEIPNA